jgi:hypothetical protein
LLKRIQRRKSQHPLLPLRDMESNQLAQELQVRSRVSIVENLVSQEKQATH